MDISFEKFEDIVGEMKSKFPKCTGWLGWYLDPKRASRLFPACKRSFRNPLTKDRFNSLCKDTNAQEGFEHILKQWVDTHETFELLLINLIEFVK
jgi:hypothetical protein